MGGSSELSPGNQLDVGVGEDLWGGYSSGKYSQRLQVVADKLSIRKVSCSDFTGNNIGEKSRTVIKIAQLFTNFLNIYERKNLIFFTLVM